MSCCCTKPRLTYGESRFPDEKADLHLLDHILEAYESEPGSLITVLQKAQDVYGYLPRSVLDHLAQRMKIKPARVYGTATFYTQFRFKPVGKYLILLCKGTACHVNGAGHIEMALTEELKIAVGETDPDGLFTLNTAACLGCCSLAPVMMINGQAYGPLTPESAVRVIRDLRSTQGVGAKEGCK